MLVLGTERNANRNRGIQGLDHVLSLLSELILIVTYSCICESHLRRRKMPQIGGENCQGFALLYFCMMWAHQSLFTVGGMPSMKNRSAKGKRRKRRKRKILRKIGNCQHSRSVL
jgi:hypothetical protein